MARKHSIVSASELKGLLAGDKDFLKELVRFVVQETPAAEMDAALGATKGERTDGRLGYRSGYYGRTLITRAWANSNFEFRRTARGIFPLRSLNVISAARRRWSRR